MGSRMYICDVNGGMVTLKFFKPRDSPGGETEVRDAGNYQGVFLLDDGNSVKWNNTICLE